MLNPQPPDHQSDAHPTEPPIPGVCTVTVTYTRRLHQAAGTMWQQQPMTAGNIKSYLPFEHWCTTKPAATTVDNNYNPTATPYTLGRTYLNLTFVTL